ncbi:MAG TPA: hypothetical protein VIG33_14625 [Pseudobdellovibrionaceae bacterium]|jgi:hypothetical protein
MGYKKNNLNHKYKLNSRLIYDRLEIMQKDLAWLGSQVGVGYQCILNNCRNQRILSPQNFERMPGALGVSRDELLLPLGGGK